MAVPEEASVAETGDQPAPAGWVERTAFDYTAMAEAETAATWDGNARVYQWKDEYGDVGPAFEELEVELFGDPESRRDRQTGLDFSKFVFNPLLIGIMLIKQGSSKLRSSRKDHRELSISRLSPTPEFIRSC